MSIKVNGKELKELIKSGEKLVVDFYADWCGPCQMFLPVFTSVSEKISTKMVKVNVDDDRDVAAELGIQGIPTIVIFENGIEKNRKSGFMNPEELIEFIG